MQNVSLKQLCKALQSKTKCNISIQKTYNNSYILCIKNYKRSNYTNSKCYLHVIVNIIRYNAISISVNTRFCVNTYAKTLNTTTINSYKTLAKQVFNNANNVAFNWFLYYLR